MDTEVACSLVPQERERERKNHLFLEGKLQSLYDLFQNLYFFLFGLEAHGVILDREIRADKELISFFKFSISRLHSFVSGTYSLYRFCDDRLNSFIVLVILFVHRFNICYLSTSLEKIMNKNKIQLL